MLPRSDTARLTKLRLEIGERSATGCYRQGRGRQQDLDLAKRSLAQLARNSIRRRPFQGTENYCCGRHLFDEW
jgi:hypothetical protein